MKKLIAIILIIILLVANIYATELLGIPSMPDPGSILDSSINEILNQEGLSELKFAYENARSFGSSSSINTQIKSRLLGQLQNSGITQISDQYASLNNLINSISGPDQIVNLISQLAPSEIQTLMGSVQQFQSYIDEVDSIAGKLPSSENRPERKVEYNKDTDTVIITEGNKLKLQGKPDMIFKFNPKWIPVGEGKELRFKFNNKLKNGALKGDKSIRLGYFIIEPISLGEEKLSSPEVYFFEEEVIEKDPNTNQDIKKTKLNLRVKEETESEDNRGVNIRLAITDNDFRFYNNIKDGEGRAKLDGGLVREIVFVVDKDSIDTEYIRFINKEALKEKQAYLFNYKGTKYKFKEIAKNQEVLFDPKSKNLRLDRGKVEVDGENHYDSIYIGTSASYCYQGCDTLDTEDDIIITSSTGGKSLTGVGVCLNLDPIDDNIPPEYDCASRFKGVSGINPQTSYAIINEEEDGFATVTVYVTETNKVEVQYEEKSFTTEGEGKHVIGKTKKETGGMFLNSERGCLNFNDCGREGRMCAKEEVEFDSVSFIQDLTCKDKKTFLISNNENSFTLFSDGRCISGREGGFSCSNEEDLFALKPSSKTEAQLAYLTDFIYAITLERADKYPNDYGGLKSYIECLLGGQLPGTCIKDENSLNRLHQNLNEISKQFDACLLNPEIKIKDQCFNVAIDKASKKLGQLDGKGNPRNMREYEDDEDASIFGFIEYYIEKVVQKDGKINSNELNNLLKNYVKLGFIKIPNYIIHIANRQYLFQELTTYIPGAGTLIKSPGVKGFAPVIEYSYLGGYLFRGGIVSQKYFPSILKRIAVTEYTGSVSINPLTYEPTFDPQGGIPILCKSSQGDQGISVEPEYAKDISDFNDWYNGLDKSTDKIKRQCVVRATGGVEHLWDVYLNSGPEANRIMEFRSKRGAKLIISNVEETYNLFKYSAFSKGLLEELISLGKITIVTIGVGGVIRLASRGTLGIGNYFLEGSKAWETLSQERKIANLFRRGGAIAQESDELYNSGLVTCAVEATTGVGRVILPTGLALIERCSKTGKLISKGVELGDRKIKFKSYELTGRNAELARMYQNNFNRAKELSKKTPALAEQRRMEMLDALNNLKLLSDPKTKQELIKIEELVRSGKL